MPSSIEVTVDGQTFRTDDLTLDESVEIEKATGVSWLNINPFRSAEQCRAIIIAFLTRERGAEEATKFAGAMTVGDALNAVRLAEDDLPEEFDDGVPLGEAGTATTGS